MPLDPTKWAALLKSEVAVIFGAPYMFTAALLVGWFVGWRVLRWWFGRQIENAKSDASTATNSANLYKEEVAIMKSAQVRAPLDVTALAEAIKTNVTLRETLKEVIGAPQVTPVDPSTPPENWVYPRTLSHQEVKKIAALSFTSSTGTTISMITPSGTYANTASPTGVEVWEKISGKKYDDKSNK